MAGTAEVTGVDDDAEVDAADGSATMNDDSGKGDTSPTEGDDTTGENRSGGLGRTNIPEESVSSESELALDRQAARRESDDGQDDE